MDTDHQADEAWVLGVQRKLYQWSKANPDDQWRDMWGWLTDSRMLRHAWRRVSTNKGGRTAGVDGMTVGRIRKRGELRFLDRLQAELRSCAYRPSPARRKLIPKAGKPGQFRPLGIPTVKDRVVQSAVKTLLEPTKGARPVLRGVVRNGPPQGGTALATYSTRYRVPRRSRRGCLRRRA